MKDQDEVNNDQVHVNDDPNDKGKSEGYSEFSSDSNEETGYPSGDKQVIRQHKLYIHSAWLALQSSYFRSLFFSGMKESSANKGHVQILANEEQAHLMLVKAIYKIDTLDYAGVDELLEVLRLAHKYEVKFVFKKCKYVLYRIWWIHLKFVSRLCALLKLRIQSQMLKILLAHYSPSLQKNSVL